MQTTPAVFPAVDSPVTSQEPKARWQPARRCTEIGQSDFDRPVPRADISIPYAAIKRYEYKEENRFHLGVVPAIAVGALKARAKRHLITIDWKDEADVAQTVTFEMTKDRAQGLMKVLEARAPEACTTGLPWRSKR